MKLVFVVAAKIASLSFCILWTPYSRASSESLKCSTIFTEPASSSWSSWWELESQFTIERFRKPIREIVITSFEVPSSDYVIEVLPGFEKIQSLLQIENSIRWWMHPWNKNSKGQPTLPNRSAQESRVGLTSSRSVIFLEEHWNKYSLKMAVDHPHGPQGVESASKADMSDDVRSALSHSLHIQNQENRREDQPKSFIVLKDIAVVRPKHSMQGQIYRDLTVLRSDRIYLPAASLSELGEMVAEKNGKDRNSFWLEHYFLKLAEVKAEFLYRYGLLFEDPHPQNFLIELYQDLKPTGRLVVRDAGDTMAYAPWARQIKLETFLKEETKRNIVPVEKLELKSFNSLFSLKAEDGGFVEAAQQRLWIAQHQKKFFEVFSRLSGHASLSLNGGGRADRFDLFDRAISQLK